MTQHQKAFASETGPPTPATSKQMWPFTLWAAPILAVVCGILARHVGGIETPAAITLTIAIWTAIWWIFESVPLAIASLLPLALLPFFGILTAEQLGESYGSKLCLLLLRGFLLSQAMERSGAHRRIALYMVNLCGGSGGRPLILGFMLATAALSMWISNAATTLMMLPIALAVLQNAPDERLKVPLLLAIAYSASVGGMATPIGTTPNLVFIDAYQEATGLEMTFLDWMRVGVPVCLAMLVVIWLWVTRDVGPKARIPLPRPGRWRAEEVRTLAVFTVVALAWIMRKAPFGGWSAWLSLEHANDASVALLGVIAMFCIPNGKGEKLLDWSSARKIPWGLLILVGAGIALGKAFKESGLSNVVADGLADLGQLPTLLIIFLVALVVTFLTEMTSNTATANLLLPILSAAAAANQLEPAMIMMPATISASCAFMLPVATMPNAIVFGTDAISIRRMAGEGLVLNLIGAVVVTGICYFLLG